MPTSSSGDYITLDENIVSSSPATKRVRTPDRMGLKDSEMVVIVRVRSQQCFLKSRFLDIFLSDEDFQIVVALDVGEYLRFYS